MMTQVIRLRRVAYFLITAVLAGSLASCRGTIPESIVTDTEQSHVVPTVTANPTKVAKPQIIERLIIKPKSLPLVSVRSLNIEVRSESEVWCERRCSQFSLLDEPGEADSLRLSVVKRTLAGNTTPGVLDLRQDLDTFGPARKNLEVMNVGVKGERVALSVDYFDQNHPNFFALPMSLSHAVVREQQIRKARFDDRDVEILLAPGCAWPDLGPVKAESQAFVMGTYLEERMNSLGQRGVFVAKKIIYPWPK